MIAFNSLCYFSIKAVIVTDAGVYLSYNVLLDFTEHKWRGSAYGCHVNSL